MLACNGRKTGHPMTRDRPWVIQSLAWALALVGLLAVASMIW
jgi:hypothetical protein